MSRLDLARLTVQGRDDLERGLRQAATASANALNVARVGVWFLSPDGESLISACQHGVTRSRDGGPEILRLTAMPRYKAAIESRRVVLVADVLTAPETSELVEGYLAPNGITSLLDAPIYRFGEVVGVVCHEHIGPPRTWTARERDFAASVADIVAVLIEQATRMDAEAQLRAQREQAVKLERQASLSRFAAGVAHDFNNVLAALGLRLEMMRDENDGRMLDDVNELLSFVAAGKGLVAQLLTYCRSGPSQPRTLSVSRVLGERRPLLEATAGHAHRLELQVLAREPLAVHIDPSQFDQVLLNLVTNAREAMPEGGVIDVTLSATPDWAVLSVKDRGVGIEASARDHIFEPFFTTKGTGTGLGLSTVFSIVQQSGGAIEVESSPGQGSLFVVRLPRVEA
jgi:signal transduction histidine kinase